VKREAPSNSKMKRLCRKLDVRLYQAVGILELLWHTTAREAPRGDIGKLTDEDIALAVDWPGDEHALINALVATGWLEKDKEHRLLVHDWHIHADEAVKKRLTRSGQLFIVEQRVATNHANVETKPPNGNLPRAGAGPEPEPEPEPVPEPDPEPEERESSAQPALPPDGGVSLAGTDDEGLKGKGNSARARAPSLKDFAECYNQHRGQLVEMRDFTAQRALALRDRRRRGLTLEAWCEGIIKAAHTAFCVGKNDRKRAFTIDDLLDEGKFTKLMEGAYSAATDARRVSNIESYKAPRPPSYKDFAHEEDERKTP
jgi:hypothetical protein